MKWLLLFCFLLPFNLFAVEADFVTSENFIEPSLPLFEINESVTMTKKMLLCQAINNFPFVFGFMFNDNNYYKNLYGLNHELGRVRMHYIGKNYERIKSKNLFYEATFDKIIFNPLYNMGDIAWGYEYAIDRMTKVLFVDKIFQKSHDIGDDKIYTCEEFLPKSFLKETPLQQLEYLMMTKYKSAITILKNKRKF